MPTLIKMKDKDGTDNEQPNDENQEHKSQNDNEDVEAMEKNVEVDRNEEYPIPDAEKEDSNDDNRNKEGVDTDNESNKLGSTENEVTDDIAQEQPIEAIQEHKSPVDTQSNNSPMAVDKNKMEQPSEAIQERQSPKKMVEDTLDNADKVASKQAMNDEEKNDSDHDEEGLIEYTSDTPVNNTDDENEDDASDFNPAEMPEKDEELSTTTTRSQKSSIQRDNTTGKSNLPTTITTTSSKTSSTSQEEDTTLTKRKGSNSSTNDKKKPGKKKKIAHEGGFKSIYNSELPRSTIPSGNITRFKLKNSRDSQLCHKMPHHVQKKFIYLIRSYLELTVPTSENTNKKYDLPPKYTSMKEAKNDLMRKFAMVKYNSASLFDFKFPQSVVRDCKVTQPKSTNNIYIEYDDVVKLFDKEWLNDNNNNSKINNIKLLLYRLCPLNGGY